MTVQKDMWSKLKDFGVNSYEAKLWAALLSRGVSTAGELSDIANVPRSRSYDVLESLEKKGFIITKIGKPIKFIAVPPEEVTERVKKRIRQDAEEQAVLLDEFRKTGLLEQLNQLYKSGVSMVEPSELSGSLKGRKNLYNQLESAIKNAKKSVVIVTTAEGALRKKDAFENVMKKANKRGIKIRFIASLTANLQKELKDINSYAELRNADINARFCVIDSEQVIFSTADEKTNPAADSGIWINSPYFASTMQKFFERMWKEAKQI